jgi:hypothetical protein
MRACRGRADDPSGNTCSLTLLSGYLQGLLHAPSPQRSRASSPSGGSSGGSGEASCSAPPLRAVGGDASRHQCLPPALALRTDHTKLDLEWDSVPEVRFGVRCTCWPSLCMAPCPVACHPCGEDGGGAVAGHGDARRADAASARSARTARRLAVDSERAVAGAWSPRPIDILVRISL